MCYTERVYKASKFFLFVNMSSHVCQNNPKYTCYTIKSSLTLALYETGTVMNARASENYLAIARSASKSVEIFWAEIYWGRFFLGSNLVSFNRAVVPLFELSFLTKSQKFTSV